jgi:predicted lipid carrier protein YhbT
VATEAQVEAVLDELLDRFREVDPGVRAMLPNRRTIEARCPDLDLVRWAEWRGGDLTVLEEPPAQRPDIRISIDSDDLLAIADGRLTFSRAYGANRLRLEASMTDLLRLRAVL